MKKIKNRLRLIFYAALAGLVPARKGLLVFAHDGENQAVAGNMTVLFRYFLDNRYDVRWLYGSSTPPSDLATCSAYVRLRSVFGFLTVLRADVVFLYKDFSDFGIWKKLARRRLVVDLGHGIPIKTVGLLDKQSNNRRMFKKSYYCNATIASSLIHRYEIAASQGRPVETIYVTGLPRNDRFLQLRDAIIDGTKDHSDEPRHILYAPTFRDYPDTAGTRFFPFDDFDADSLAQHLKRLNAKLALRPHHFDTVSNELIVRLSATYPEAFESATEEEVPDTPRIMAASDAVVTDYSSIYVDMLLADIPCIFIPYDLARYDETRGVTYDYELITPGPKVDSQKALVEAIEDALTGAHEWKDKRAFVRRMFHAYEDTGACQRVARMIEHRRWAPEQATGSSLEL